jgi:glycosyltransferase involved in cell wall biosynthesis
MKSICLINDFAENTGAGKYGLKLYQHLAGKAEVDYYYLNFSNLSLDKKCAGGYVTVKEIKCKWLAGKFKPIFWRLLKGQLPPYALYHFLTPNISFLSGQGPSMVTCHDIAPLFMPVSLLEKIGRKYLYSGIKRSSCIITDSSSSRQDVIKAYGIKPEKIAVIPLGVDHDVFKPADKKNAREKLGLALNAKIILSVSLEMWRKNIPGAIKAFADLKRKHPEAVMIRTARLKASTKKLVDILGLNNSVIVMENINEVELALLYNAADVLFFPSFYEGFGLPPLEAMACGCPVVAANATSLPEVVGPAGLLVDPRDIKAMAAALEQVLYDGAVRDNLINSGLKWVKKYKWEDTAMQTLAVYEKQILK